MDRLSLGLYKSPVKKTDWLLTSLVEDLVGKKLPAIDLTDEQSPVKMQGKKGACAGFAGIAWVEYANLKDYYMIPAEYNSTVDFSEQMLYELARRYSRHAEGTTLDAIRHILQTVGVCRESYCPYTDDKTAPFHLTYEMEADADNFKIEKNYVRVASERELHAALHRYGAFNIGVKVTEEWNQQKNGYIPKMNAFKRFFTAFNIGVLGGHAIQLVGKDPDTGYYKFKNSWDVPWGNKGYGYIHEDDMAYILMDGIVMFDIDDENKYPPKIKTVSDLTLAERWSSCL